MAKLLSWRDGEIIELEDLSVDESAAAGQRMESPLQAIADAADEETVLSMEEVKRCALEHAYRLCDGNVERTALRLGITRSTVYRLLKKYGVEEPVNA